jgi:ATP dependent DNA ligase domain
VVVASGAGLDFEALLQRIHPADSRVRLLAAETPALLIAFDLLSLDDRSLLQRPFAERRAALEAALAGAGAPVHTTPATCQLPPPTRQAWGCLCPPRDERSSRYRAKPGASQAGWRTCLPVAPNFERRYGSLPALDKLH